MIKIYKLIACSLIFIALSLQLSVHAQDTSCVEGISCADNKRVETVSFDCTGTPDCDINFTMPSDAVAIYVEGISKGANPADQFDIAIRYSFNDKDAAYVGERLFYRIKQVDFDGQFSYTPVRFVSFDSSVITPKVFPNPATEGQPITIHATQIDDVTLFDAQGKIVTIINGEGERATSIDTSDFSRGIYFVVINGGSDTFKFMIQ